LGVDRSLTGRGQARGNRSLYLRRRAQTGRALAAYLQTLPSTVPASLAR